MRFTLPRFGDRLLARISPVIGIVIIEEKFESKRFGLLRQCDGVWQAVWKCGRSMKQTETNPVIAVIPQDLQTRLRLAFILEHYSLSLGLREEGNVCAYGVV